jgi:hypothetical protein
VRRELIQPCASRLRHALWMGPGIGVGGGRRLIGVGEKLARDPTSISFLLFIRRFVSSGILCGHKNEQMKERLLVRYVRATVSKPLLSILLLFAPSSSNAFPLRELLPRSGKMLYPRLPQDQCVCIEILELFTYGTPFSRLPLYKAE